MWQKVVTFCTVWIAIASAATHTFTTTNTLANHLGSQPEFQCALNEPCVIYCQGNGACDALAKNIKGPGATSPLSIFVDSDTNTNLGPYAFRSNVYCAVTADCSELRFYVTGDGTNQVAGSQIHTPDTGVTIFDSSGNAISGGYYAHSGISFYGINGLGDKVGQVKIVDTSGTPGRTNINEMRYTCTSNNGLTWGDQCSTMTWNNNKGYLECTSATLLSCQVTDPPTPYVPVVAPIAPAPRTASGGLGTPALRTGSSGVTVSEVDYYIMRLCQVIVVIGMFVWILNVVMGFIRNYNKQRYSYSKIIYNTDVTDVTDVTDEES